jgi:NADH-quinone oxidoreductase subunit J
MYLDILFYLFSSVLVLASVGVVAFKNPMYSLLCLILAFFNASGLFVLLGAEFLAFLLIMVYVGAVVVMFMFAVMTLDVDKLKYKSFGPFPAIAIAVLISEIITLLMFKGDTSLAEQTTLNDLAATYANVNNTMQIGDVMFTTFAYPFILISLVLLVAMIGAIVLTFNPVKNRKQQDIAKQIQRKREDSIELKKVKSGSGVNF